jgi:hypothetical protein
MSGVAIVAKNRAEPFFRDDPKCLREMRKVILLGALDERAAL